MSDVAGWEVVASGELDLSGLGTTERTALGEQAGPGRAVNRTIDATSAAEGSVGGLVGDVSQPRGHDDCKSLALNIDDLTPSERLDPIGRLWNSLSDEQVPLTDEERDLLDERLDRIDGDGPSGVAWTDISAGWAAERKRR